MCVLDQVLYVYADRDPSLIELICFTCSLLKQSPYSYSGNKVVARFPTVLHSYALVSNIQTHSPSGCIAPTLQNERLKCQWMGGAHTWMVVPIAVPDDPEGLTWRRTGHGDIGWAAPLQKAG